MIIISLDKSNITVDSQHQENPTRGTRILLCGPRQHFEARSQNCETGLLASVMSVCPFVHAHVTTRLPLDGFSWNLIFEDFSKICRENLSFIKIGQTKWYFTQRPMYIFIISRSFLLRMRNVSGKCCREDQNTHFVFSSFLENGAVYEIMCKGIVVQGNPQVMIRRMRTACWIPKATNTYSGCVIRTAFPLQQWLHERASMLR